MESSIPDNRLPAVIPGEGVIESDKYKKSDVIPGRPPTEITPELCRKAESLAAQGMNQDEIAYCLGMGSTTFYVKKKEFPEFSEAIKAGQAKGIAKVTNSLMKSAMNGNVQAQKFYLACRANWLPGTLQNSNGQVVLNITQDEAEL